MGVGTTAGLARVKKSEEHTYCVVQYKKYELVSEDELSNAHTRERVDM